MASLECSWVEATESQDAECIYRQVITVSRMFSNGNMTVSDCPFPGVQWDYAARLTCYEPFSVSLQMPKSLITSSSGEENQQPNVKRSS